MANTESLENFTRALGHIRSKVRPLARMNREEVGACVSSQEGAKLSVALAYGLASLFYMYLRTQGVAPDDHPVKNDLRRIQEKVTRLNQVTKGKKESRKLVVDQAASRRFIEAALASDPVYREAKGTAEAKESEGNRDGEWQAQQQRKKGKRRLEAAAAGSAISDTKRRQTKGKKSDQSQA